MPVLELMVELRVELEIHLIETSGFVLSLLLMLVFAIVFVWVFEWERELELMHVLVLTRVPGVTWSTALAAMVCWDQTREAASQQSDQIPLKVLECFPVSKAGPQKLAAGIEVKWERKKKEREEISFAPYEGVLWTRSWC